MPDALPIDLLPEAAAEYAMTADEIAARGRARLAVRDRRCGQLDGATIVVCAPTESEEERFGFGPELPPALTPLEELRAKMNWKAGPVEIGVGQGDGAALPRNAAGVTARIRF